jgi:hypothetical protein
MINKDRLLRFIGILDETLGELKAISDGHGLYWFMF